MAKELFVSSTPHETKVAIAEDDLLAEVYYERENEYTLAGSIYKGRVTRVLPGMQSAFVNVGLERDAFLYVSDFLLEEEDDAEALEQVITRSRVEAPEPETRMEAQPGPIEAEEIIPPAGPHAREQGEEPFAAGPEAESEPGEGDREGTRQWRGRRRRGRGRFQERGPERTNDRPAERGANRPSERGEHGPRPVNHVEPAAEPRPQPPLHAPVHTQAHGGYGPIVLPGESLSKYQPHSATPAPPKPQTPAQPASQYRSKPSTEYSVDASQFAPGSMVLPGESISKYRNEDRSAHKSVARAQEHAAVEEGLRPPVTTAGTEGIKSEHLEEEPRQRASYAIRHDLGYTATAQEPEEEVEARGPHTESASIASEQTHLDRKTGHVDEEQERLEQMNVASVFGGGAVETPEEIEETEVPHFTEKREPARSRNQKESPYGAQPPSAATEESSHTEEHSSSGSTEQTEQHSEEAQSRLTLGRGQVEEEEIEDEESELPEYEEDFDLSDFEELEEEEMARADEQMAQLGSQVTEAVRDAHVNERATGQYEAEGLEGGDELADMEVFGAAEEGEEEEEEDQGQDEVLEETGESQEAGTSGTRAPQQQRLDRDRGSTDRRNRKFGRRMRGRPRHFVQRQLPAISDLLKEGQEILVQIAKEPIAKKGARITSHIALPGRFLVYMPTVHHTGVSRKIASEEERQRLKRIVLSERGDAHGGFIVRTAASGANEEDLRADIRFLINLWNEIKGRADKSKAPSLIYHDLNLVERILRDQVTVSFSSIWVDTEQEYERILRFVSRFQPSLVKRVKLYTKETPLFEQFNITDEINKALKSKVWLKSGGYIVINQTEALVAIDVNTGKFVGKTTRLEDTIVKTNIDAIREIVRQIRLRDLGGIIVIDFIDMDERKNRQKVMQALEEALKADRAPSKVLQFNDFGLVAITRKRVKQSLERTLGQPCPICTGTGMIKSVSTVCNEIYVEMRKMSRHFEHDVMLRVNPEVAKALKASNARWLQEMEDLTRRTILVKSDALLHPEQFDIQ